MTVVQKFVGGLVLIALVTTMVLPRRQTPAVINAVGQQTGYVLGVAEGTK